MKKLTLPVAVLGLLVSGLCLAQAPAGAPAGATALCKDGSYFSGTTKSGACRGHKGIKEWFGGEAPAAKGDAATSKADEKAAKAQAKADEKAAKAKAREEAKTEKAKAREEAKAAKSAPVAPAAAAPTPAPMAPKAATPMAPASAAAPAAPVAKATAVQKSSAPAAGGGPGMVWVNASTKVYHCPGTRWYGKTKEGEYMSESEAKAKGFHGDHNKTCGS